MGARKRNDLFNHLNMLAVGVMPMKQKLCSFFLSGLVLFFYCASPNMAQACVNNGVDSRLKVYCLTNKLASSNLSLEQLVILDHLYKQEGYNAGVGIATTVQLNQPKFFASPIIEHNSNINGGNPVTPLRLGSLTFDGDPLFFKKSGMAGGMQFGTQGRQISGPGRYLDYYLEGSLVNSTDYDMQIFKYSASVCGKNRLRQLFYADFCVTSNRQIKELTDTEAQAASASLVKLFKSGGDNYHKVSFGFVRSFEKTYNHNQLSMKLSTIHPGRITSAIALNFGEFVSDSLSTRLKVATELTFQLFSRPMNVTLSVSKADGGKILDFDLEETTQALSLNYKLLPWLSLVAGYSSTDSNVNYFDAEVPTFGVNFSPITF
jgi:hypothetical protein